MYRLQAAANKAGEAAAAAAASPSASAALKASTANAAIAAAAEATRINSDYKKLAQRFDEERRAARAMNDGAGGLSLIHI